MNKPLTVLNMSMETRGLWSPLALYVIGATLVVRIASVRLCLTNIVPDARVGALIRAWCPKGLPRPCSLLP